MPTREDWEQQMLVFEPISIADIQIRNRIIMAPMATGFATRDGHVTGQMINYYAARAYGGVGLVTVEATAVDPTGRGWLHNLCVYDDRFLPGLERMASGVKASGAKISLQLFHAGRQTSYSVIGTQPLAPSPVPCRNGEIPKELGLLEIEDIIRSFAESAARAQRAGFDAVCLHMGHGYLVNQFLSPYSNHRLDEYGGHLEGRARFALEIVKAVRERVGQGFPVTSRISADEFVDGGLNIDETIHIAGMLERVGIDAIDVSAGTGAETNYEIIPLMDEPRGCRVDLAEKVKRTVKIAVSAVGRINDPILANEILLEEKADLISLGRALIADPEFPRKALDGRVDDICPCIACNIGCVDRLGAGLDIACTTNPSVGREMYSQVGTADRRQRVLVVGGGPAGMEAARVAALRGHEVVLCERDSKLGGEMNIAALPPHKEEIGNFIKYLSGQIAKLGIEVQLGKYVSGAVAEELAPDSLIIATGAFPLIPDFARTAEIPVMTARDALLEKESVGSATIVIGSGQIGCETADFLLSRGVSVCILEMLERIAPDMSYWSREVLVERLLAQGVDMLVHAKVIAIEGDTVVIDRGGIERSLENVDTVILAVGYGPVDNDELQSWAKGRGMEVHRAGDCVAPRNIMYAVNEGFEAACRL